MWSELFTTSTADKVLLYLNQYEEGYALGIARTFKLPVSQIQRQLLRFEKAGVLASQLKGKTRVFVWNPRCYYLKELRALLKRITQFLPKEIIDAYFMERRRPRRTGKPL